MANQTGCVRAAPCVVQNMKKKDGITLISIAITVIVLAILSGVAIYAGTEVIEQANIVKFTSELTVAQKRINEIYDDIQLGNTFYYQKGDKLNELSQNMLEKINNVFSLEGIGTTQRENFIYFDKTKLSSIGLEGIDQSLLINFNDRRVISVDGVKKGSITFYSEQSLNGGPYNVSYDQNKNVGDIEFSVNVTKNTNYWTIKLDNIKYPGYVNSGTVWYKLENETNWIRAKKYEFYIYEKGTYDIKLVDSAGNIKQVKQIIS